MKDKVQGLEYINTLLSGRRDVTADTTEVLCSLLSTEATGDLLLNLHHSQVSLRQIVVKRHPKIIHEPECFVAVFL